MKPSSLFKLAPLSASLFALAAPAFAQTATAPTTPATSPATSTQNGPAGVAATVNGDKIETRDIERFVKRLQADDPYAQGDSADSKARIAQYRTTVVDVLIAQRLMAQEAARQKITPTKDELDALVLKIKQGNNLKDDKELSAYLAKDGKSIADLRRLLGESLATDKLKANWIADVAVSEADIAQFYKANPDLFRESDQVRARHILLAIAPGASDADRAKIKARAQQLFKQASVKNADFAKLAQANSDDPGSKTQGGDVGWFGRGMMVKPFEDAAFNAQPKTVVGPVLSDFGYHILKVEAKRPARMIPLASVKADPRLKDAVLQQKRQKRVDDQVSALKLKAQIQRFG